MIHYCQMRRNPQKKRKFDPLVSELEKTKNMKVLDKILGPQEGKIDANKAANMVIREQQQHKRKANQESNGKKKSPKKKKN